MYIIRRVAIDCSKVTASRSHDFPSFAYLGVCVCVCVFLFVYDWLNDIKRNKIKNRRDSYTFVLETFPLFVCFVSIVHVYDSSLRRVYAIDLATYIRRKKEKKEKGRK